MAERTTEISPRVLTDLAPSIWRQDLSSGVIAAGYLLVTLLAICFQRPPEARPATAPLTEFSSERAMNHLRVIASRPHPIGSVAHEATLAYLQAELSRMGLSPQVQRTTSISQTRGAFYKAATVQNLLARLKGTGDGQAVLLLAHFDSASVSPGASDDGAAIAALLETLRVLQASEPLKNDLIFLFTDAEEVGLLGVQAFVNEHPWFKDVRIALNFEARGSSGPSMMFETSDQNGWLISKVREAVPSPRTNSLMYDIYRLLPNNSDLSILKKAGVAGLNFAYLDDAAHYHTSLDSVRNIDERSLQHHGAYALSLSRYLGNQSLATTTSANVVYFDLLGLTIVYYAYTWIGPLTLLVLLLFVGVVVLGFRKKRLSLRGIGQGSLFPFVSMIAAVISVSLVWQVVSTVHGSYRLMTLGETYNSSYYRLGFVALTIALTSLLLRWFQNRISEPDLIIGTLLWWAILLVLTSLYLPGGSYLFLWPLLFVTIGSATILTAKDTGTIAPIRSLSLCVCMIPGLFLFVPLIQLLLIGLTISMAAVVMIPVVLLLVLLLPRLGVKRNASRWVLPAIAALLSVVFLVAGSLTAGSNSERPRPNTIFYGLNADTGQSVWASEDEKPDEWTRQFFAADYKKGQLFELFPLNSRSFLNSVGPQLDLAPPVLKVLDDTASQGIRTVKLLITSSRQAAVMSVYEESNAEITSAIINGKRVFPEASEPTRVGRWALRFFGVPSEGIELVMEVKSPQPLKLRLVDQSYGLPRGNDSISDRPSFMTAGISPDTDSAFVSKTFIF